MSSSRLESLRIKAKLLQKAKGKAGTPIRLKDAFARLAQAAGFSSWRDLKETLDANEALCPAGQSAHWKVWYSSYAEAVSHLHAHGGFLLPYQKDFFICTLDYIQFLGVAGDDRDLEKVGSNWAEPRDAAAFARLLKKVKSGK